MAMDEENNDLETTDTGEESGENSSTPETVSKADFDALRNQHTDLMKKFEASQQAQAKPTQPAEPPAAEAPAVDYEGEIEKIQKGIESGEISLEDGMRRSNAISMKFAEDVATRKAASITQKMLQERDVQDVQKQWLKDNPDFMQMKQSGELDKVKSDNPLHDDISAYYALKAQSAFDAGKAEMEKLAKGADPSKSVLNSPGSEIRRPTKPKAKLSDAELKRSMLAAVNAVNG